MRLSFNPEYYTTIAYVGMANMVLIIVSKYVFAHWGTNNLCIVSIRRFGHYLCIDDPVVKMIVVVIHVVVRKNL